MRAFLLVLPLALGLLSATSADTNRELLRVGSRSVSLAEAEARSRQLGPAAMAELTLQQQGASARAFVEQYFVPELLLDQHVAALRLEPQAAVSVDHGLALALEQQLLRAAVVNAAEVEQYYNEHRDRFQRAESIAVWRIVLEDEASARQVLAEVRASATGAALWSNLARERSLDGATKMRSGSIGFVQPDGRTDVPEVRVNPAVYDAVAKLKDGELAPEPFADGEHFSALWRRGSIAAREVSLEQAREEINDVLQRERAALDLQVLIDKLRAENLSGYAPDVLELIDYPVPASDSRVQAQQAHAADRKGPAPRPTAGDR
jgi:peptidyl-prolyl cis-trans isomerase C